ncbi:hypothetical protein FB45DRAFT_869164 [Roridomyces roridus]|uniref:Uncharacterized protein n=1 Tax=Roridomyces roridus TaxID=1738132 RepID=A0AAD7FIP8_9AGAR|nr:hypothetical protein FB45DRAFT_869164 [Roridomyces roridus]
MNLEGGYLEPQYGKDVSAKKAWISCNAPTETRNLALRPLLAHGSSRPDLQYTRLHIVATKSPFFFGCQWAMVTPTRMPRQAEVIPATMAESIGSRYFPTMPQTIRKRLESRFMTVRSGNSDNQPAARLGIVKRNPTTVSAEVEFFLACALKSAYKSRHKRWCRTMNQVIKSEVAQHLGEAVDAGLGWVAPSCQQGCVRTEESACQSALPGSKLDGESQNQQG